MSQAYGTEVRSIHGSGGTRSAHGAGTRGIIVVSQPASWAGLWGSTNVLFTFTVAVPFGSATYQWYKDGNAIAGATYANYTVSTVDDTKAGAYTCDAKWVNDKVTSNPATLTVTGRKAYIITQPSVPINIPSPASWSMTIVFNGNPTPTVQWQESHPTAWYANNVEYYPTAYSAWADIPGATGVSFNGTNFTSTLSGSNYRYRIDNYKSFRCVVSNTIGGVAYPVTSVANSVIIAPRTIIWSGPNPINNLSVLPGTPVTCTVAASVSGVSGSGDLQPFEWRDYWDQYGILAYGNSYTISGVLGSSDGAWKGYCRTVGPDTKWSSSNYTGWIDWKLKP